MTELIIYTDTMTAIELVYGDDVKYVETFNSWEALLSTLFKYMDCYVCVSIRAASPARGLFSLQENN